MATVVLTIIDTAGIQDYVFASNRLRENIGASFLVEQATRDWVYTVLPELHNWNFETRQINSALHIEQDNLAAELIYAGGGNTVILFKSLAVAKPLRGTFPEGC